MLIGQLLRFIGIDTGILIENIQKRSIGRAGIEQGYLPLMQRLRSIRPDPSEQYSSGKELYNDDRELKVRTMHAFQCMMTFDAI